MNTGASTVRRDDIVGHNSSGAMETAPAASAEMKDASAVSTMRQ